MKKIVFIMALMVCQTIFAKPSCDFQVIDGGITAFVEGKKFVFGDDASMYELANDSRFQMLIVGTDGTRLFLDDIFELEEILVLTVDNNVYQCKL